MGSSFVLIIMTYFVDLHKINNRALLNTYNFKKNVTVFSVELICSKNWIFFSVYFSMKYWETGDIYTQIKLLSYSLLVLCTHVLTINDFKTETEILAFTFTKKEQIQIESFLNIGPIRSSFFLLPNFLNSTYIFIIQ